jgi:uncharacterized protein YlzI (FlbEa/FlbD family)
MKIIEFEVLVKLVNDSHIDYSSLGIAPPLEDEEELFSEKRWYNSKWLEAEIECVAENKENTILNLYDGRCIFVQEPINVVLSKLNDT